MSYILEFEKKHGFEKKLEQVQSDIVEVLVKDERSTEIQKINREMAADYSKRWAAGDRKGLTFAETGLFSRVQTAIPSIGKSPEITSAAFDENAKIQKEPQVFEAAGGIIIAKVKSKELPDMSKFDSEKEKQFKTMQARKLEAFFPAWMQNVETQFPVKINTAMMERFQKASQQ